MTDTSKSSRSTRSNVPTTPEEFPTTPPPIPLAALDQSFVLQIMLDLKGSMAKLDESISNLKEQYREHDQKLDSVSQEVYAAKRVVTVAAWAIGLLVAAIAVLYPIIHSAK
jgi:hypothetical protein